jgi:protein-disulfide isomerase
MAYAVSWTRRFVGLALIVALVAGAGGIAAAQAPPEMLRASPQGAIATDPKRDAALIDFLQKRFKIGSAQIRLGPMIPAGIDDLYARQIYVTNEQGQTGSSLLFLNREQTKAIVAQGVLDLTKDAWDRQDMSKAHIEDHGTMGPADAPVTIVEFADFECPYCAHAFSVMETLVNNTYKGKIKLIYKNYPLNLHPWAIKAAQAAECARLQNPEAFWGFARYFYENQGSINPKNVDDHITKIAKKLNLDDSTLNACMTTAGAARVQQDQADGTLLHVNSTPTFFVNGIPVVGLPDNKSMEFVINSELNGPSQAAK